jgi:hypothetical protein
LYLFFVSTSTAKGYSKNVHGTFQEVKGPATPVAMAKHIYGGIV